jgi:hypothetical protein
MNQKSATDNADYTSSPTDLADLPSAIGHPPSAAAPRPGCLPCPRLEHRGRAGYYCRHPNAALTRRGLPVAALIGASARRTPTWCPLLELIAATTVSPLTTDDCVLTTVP